MSQCGALAKSWPLARAQVPTVTCDIFWDILE